MGRKTASKRKAITGGALLVALSLVVLGLRAALRSEVRFSGVGRSQVLTPDGVAVSMATLEGRVIGAVVFEPGTETTTPPFMGGRIRSDPRATSPVEVSLAFASPSGPRTVQFIVARHGAITLKMPDGAIRSATDGAVLVLDNDTGDLRTLPIRPAGSPDDFFDLIISLPEFSDSKNP